MPHRVRPENLFQPYRERCPHRPAVRTGRNVSSNLRRGRCPRRHENIRNMHRIFCRISAIAEMILHLKPLAKHSQPCGTHPNGLNGTGRAKGSLNRRFKRRFLHTFCRCWQKVCRRRHLPTFQTGCPHTADNQMYI